MRTFALQIALALMVFPTPWAEAQPDSTTNAPPLSGPPTGEPQRSSSLALFAGFQQGIQTKQEQTTQDIGWLVGAAPNIRLGAAWELSPELSLWRMSVYRKEQWNLRVALPVRWFPWTGAGLSGYTLAGFGILFAGGP